MHPYRVSRTCSWALRYVSQGWRVYPVERHDKRPMFSGWLRDATTEPDMIARTWRREPVPNIGIICGETFDVVDIEAAHVDAFRRAVGRHGRFDAYPLVRSGRGGIHVYVAPLGLGTRRLELEGVHIGEWKGSGGVVAPPSTTVASYTWIRPPTQPSVPDAPSWLRALIVSGTRSDQQPPVGRLTPSRAVALGHALYRVVAEATEGERNRILFWASCRAAEHGLEPSAVTDILLAAARVAGLPEQEARRTITSGFQR